MQTLAEYLDASVNTPHAPLRGERCATCRILVTPENCHPNPLPDEDRTLCWSCPRERQPSYAFWPHPELPGAVYFRVPYTTKHDDDDPRGAVVIIDANMISYVRNYQWRMYPDGSVTVAYSIWIGGKEIAQHTTLARIVLRANGHYNMTYSYLNNARHDCRIANLPTWSVSETVDYFTWKRNSIRCSPVINAAYIALCLQRVAGRRPTALSAEDALSIPEKIRRTLHTRVIRLVGQ